MLLIHAHNLMISLQAPLMLRKQVSMGHILNTGLDSGPVVFKIASGFLTQVCVDQGQLKLVFDDKNCGSIDLISSFVFVELVVAKMSTKVE
jgi:hypothetical protein